VQVGGAGEGAIARLQLLEMPVAEGVLVRLYEADVMQRAAGSAARRSPAVWYSAAAKLSMSVVALAFSMPPANTSPFRNVYSIGVVRDTITATAAAGLACEQHEAAEPLTERP